MSDIDTEVVGSLKVLDPRRPIREEADIDQVAVNQLRFYEYTPEYNRYSAVRFPAGRVMCPSAGTST